MFETRRDKRLFLALVARSVRRGELRVLAFCVMTTHYHLLVQSVHGRLDAALQRIQSDYSRYFNRTRKRDGPLVRGRYSSKRIESSRYLSAVTVYIEANAQLAGMSSAPDDYEFSSAYRLSRGIGLSWLEVEGRSCRGVRRRGESELRKLAELVEARLDRCGTEDPIDSLCRSTPPAILAWMRSKARLADGTEIGLPVAHHDDVESSWSDRVDEIRLLPRPGRTAHATTERCMLCGLLRLLCGLRQREIAAIVGLSSSGVGKLLDIFAHRIIEDAAFGGLAARVSQSAIRRGPLGRVDEEVVGFV